MTQQLSFNLGVEDIELLSGESVSSNKAILILLNGRILGIHRSPDKFMWKMRQMTVVFNL